MSAKLWLLAGGIAGGVIWFTRRSHAQTETLTREPRGTLTRRYDELFLRHGQGIPVAYLRALAHAESGMRADDPMGLINVVSVALADFNRRHPSTPVAAANLRDPAISIRVASDILRTVIASYAKHHPDVPNLREDWDNPRFVELVTAGWLCARAHNHPYANCGVMRSRSACPPLLVGREQSDAEGRSHNA